VLYGAGFIAFGIVMTLGWFLFWCLMRPYFKLSAAVLKIATTLTCRYPSTICLVVLQGLVQILVAVGLGVTAAMIAYCKMNAGLYVYLLFTFLWISHTFAYVVYLTLAGLAGSWYFLTDTEYESKTPVWDSFKRAATTSFGSAALAAFLIAVIELLKAIVKQKCEKQNAGILILRCLALCILSCLEMCVKWIARYALIYCAVFGVPFSEGCRRWAELSVKKFVDVLVTGCVITRVLLLNLLLFAVGAGLIGFGVGYAVFDGKSDDSDVPALVAIGTAMITIAIFVVLEQPIRAMSDTILVCFAEAPERLESSAAELYNIIARYYKSAVDTLVETGRR
jgi:hypothetical protein